MEENKKTNWLLVENGTRGEREVSWVKNKTYDDIFNYMVGVVEYYYGIGNYSKEYIEETYNVISNKDIGLEYNLNDEEWIGYYREDKVKELVGLDLDKEENKDIIYNVIDKVEGIR